MRSTLVLIFLSLSLVLAREFTMYQYFFAKFKAGTRDSFGEVLGINGTIVLPKSLLSTLIGGAGYYQPTFHIVGFTGKVTKVTRSAAGVTEIKADCVEGVWNTQKLGSFLVGTINITINGTMALYHGVCVRKDTGMQYEISAEGHETPYVPFAGSYTYALAKQLMGSFYTAIQLVNDAVFMYPYFPYAKNCSWYRDNFIPANETRHKCIIVGNGGEHCGIMDYSGDWFIHTDPAKKTVVRSPVAQAKRWFKSGYVFRECQMNN